MVLLTCDRGSTCYRHWVYGRGFFTVPPSGPVLVAVSVAGSRTRHEGAFAWFRRGGPLLGLVAMRLNRLLLPLLLSPALLVACDVLAPTPEQTPDIPATAEAQVGQLMATIRAAQTPTPLATPNIEATVTAAVQAALAAQATATPVPTRTPSPVAAPTLLLLPTVSLTDTPIDKQTPEPKSTPTQMLVPTRAPTATPIPVRTPVPTATAIPTPTPSPVPTPTPQPTPTQVVRKPELVFESDRHGNLGIYVMEATPRAGPIRLTAEPDIDATEPTWAPDGNRIIFVTAHICTRVVPGGVNRTLEKSIFIMDADGLNVAQLTEPTDECFSDNQPDISPDGRRIAFTSSRSGDSKIFTMDISGANVRQVTENYARSPRWSPDGSKILFFGIGGGIWTMNKDGSDQTLLLEEHDFAGPEAAAWSPDGAWITYSTGRGSELKSCRCREIYVMSSDGGVHLRLTNSPTRTNNRSPAWSPDGTEVVFNSSNFGSTAKPEIFVINTDGSNLRQLTFHPAVDRYPRWRP